MNVSLCHPRANVERQRSRIVRGEGRPRPVVHEQGIEEQPTDPLTKTVGSDEEIGQVPAMSGRDRRSERGQPPALVGRERLAVVTRCRT
jgi:hypothetical protein